MTRDRQHPHPSASCALCTCPCDPAGGLAVCPHPARPLLPLLDVPEAPPPTHLPVGQEVFANERVWPFYDGARFVLTPRVFSTLLSTEFLVFFFVRLFVLGSFQQI